MAQFDPATATAAYMASLSPAAHAKATAYTHGGEWLLFWGWLVGVVIALLIARSGVLVRAEAGIERRRRRPNLAVAAVSALFILVDAVLELPWSAYSGWWREKQYGLTHQPFGGWLGEQLLALVISLVFTVAFLVLLYALIRRAQRSWWIWTGGLAATAIVLLMLIGPIFIEPLFNTYTPAPNGPVRDEVVALAKIAGVPYDKIYIYNGSKQSNRYTANVSGLGGSARVAMSDVMFAKGADLAEVRGVVGHEMGHYKRYHILWSTLASALMAIVAAFIVDRTFPWVAKSVGGGARGLGDPAGLPVLAIIAATLGLLATPLNNTISRAMESDADSFSLRYANAPDGLSKALVKTIEYRASSPSRLEEVIFYDHPSVERRVRKAMEWKATHPPG